MSQDFKGEPNSTIDYDDEDGEFTHVRHFDIRPVAGNYSNIAGVLAGFALAAVILVLQLPHSTTNDLNVSFTRDWATIAFLVAFFGCLFSAFLFTSITGEEVLLPRTNMAALFTGAAFGVSMNLVLWGLITIVKVYLDVEVVTIARLLFPIFAALQPLFLGYTALDNIFLFRKHHPNDVYNIGCDSKIAPKNLWVPMRREWVAALAPSYLVFVVAIIVKFTVPLFWSGQIIPALSDWLLGSVIAALIVFVLSTFLALYASDKHRRFNLMPLTCGIWLVFPEFVLGLLILTV